MYDRYYDVNIFVIHTFLIPPLSLYLINKSIFLKIQDGVCYIPIYLLKNLNYSNKSFL